MTTMPNEPYVTRIAPSPTGDMHLGTVRTAYFNWLTARASGGRFILRIDDTDVQRNDRSKIDDIFSIMAWLDLDYDQIVYQSDRLKRYREVVDILIQDGHAKILDNQAVQLTYVPNSLPTWIDNLAGNVSLTERDLDHIKSLILIKSDGFPTYNFASVIDDIDLGINYIIRGTDHIGNTSKQIVLFDLLKAKRPQFAHVGLLFYQNKKMSKRDNTSSMMQYIRDDYDPEAILNFILRLGWGPKVDDKTTSILTRDRALSLFLPPDGRMKNSPANVDLDKLLSFDRKYKARKLNI